MTLASIPYLAKQHGPEWLPAAAAQGRQFAYWGQLILLSMAVILIAGGAAITLSGGYSIGVYVIIAGAVDLLLFTMMPGTVFAPVDHGRFREASDRLLLWGVLGLLFGVAGGPMLLVAYIKLQDVFQPQYQQYPPGQYYEHPHYQQPRYQPAPPPYQAPPRTEDELEMMEMVEGQGPVQIPAPEPPRRAEMAVCRSCGVQFPSFMRYCPNCGAPRD